MIPRVKEILKVYEIGNIVKVREYLNQPEMIVDSSTWAGKIKRMIKEEKYTSVKGEIELVGYKLSKAYK